MDPLLKQVLVIMLSGLIGLGFFVFGVYSNLHFFMAEITDTLIIELLDQGPELSQLLAYTLQFFIAAIVLVTPFSLVGGFWYISMANELVFGFNADKNVFIISPVLNQITAILCVTLFLYSILVQYAWSKKLTQVLPVRSKDKDLAKLI